MNVLFLLFVISILLLLIFWELSKINTRLKKALGSLHDVGHESKPTVP